MRSVEVTAHVLEADLSQPCAWSFSTAKRRACLVEIAAEDGTAGWGECFGPADLNAAVIGAFRPYLLGADALASDRVWMELHGRFRDQGQKRLMITALSGIYVAYCEAPVQVLMGGAVLTAPIEADAGMAALPEAVGLGINIDRGVLERFRKTPDRC
jgi:D-galactarolactone cycloisomerase